MHSTLRKLNFLIAFGAFFAALSLSGGCTNLFSSNSPNNDAPAQIKAKEGYGIITGSVPAANSVSPRTAMPDPDKAKPSSFKVFAENGSSTVPITVDASGNFSIQLPYGTWEITAQGLNSAGKAIYTQTKKVTLSAANSQVDLKFTLGYSTNPDDGDGEISLSVSFPPKSATSSIKAIEYTLSKGESKSVVKISEEELAAGAFKIARICEDLGTYTLTINFYGDIGNLVYRIDEKVQVYANLITDTFLEGSAPYVSGGEIVLTQALLDEFVQTTLYVDAGSGKDSNSGTQFDPLKTFNRAVEMVNNASDSLANAEFRIYLKTDVADGAFLELKDGRKLTVASSDGTARTIESLERQFNVASTSELTVNDIKFQKMSFRVAGTLEMNGCEISGNTKNENGGAAYVDGGTFTIENCTISGNKASNYGGGVYVASGEFTMVSGEISGNTATNYGGGVFVDTSGTFEMQNGAIGGAGTKKNTAKYGGGVAVYGNGVFTMGGGTISANNASINGGAIYARGGTLTIKSGAEISGNSAATNGGGVFIGSGSLAMSGGSITENKIEYSGPINASTTALYNGGGVYIGGSGEFTMSGGTISKNTATCSGEITGVSNVFNGGGVYVEAGGEFTMSDGEITGNRASLFGGGVSVNGNVNGNGGTFTLSSGAMISTNTANEGGGVHISGGTFEMTGGTITQNTSAESGGGVYATAASTFTMQRGEISENTATAGSGGGIYIENNATFEMTGGEINRNTSGDSAGGIFIYDGSAFTMSGGEISGNKAASNAGGVFVHKGTTFTMEAGTISDNTATVDAGGVYVDVDDSTFTMKRGTISGNQANLGGGVYIIGDPSTGKYGTFTMENGTISGNTANTDGGGVYVENAVFTMENGTITENEAKGDFSVMFGGGGGVYIVNTMSTSSLPTFTMKDGVISKNKANMGGGVYSLYYSEFTMSGGTFSGNEAAQQGSGAYIYNVSTFNMSGSAKFEEDDDVYLYGEVTTPATITVTGALEATSPVATITPSTYNEGREILTAGAGITKEQMQAICRQFALTPEPLPDGATEYTATRWGISPASDYTKGVLGKVLNELYVSENGDDTNLGTKESPFKTMEKAIEMLKEYNDGASEYTIYVHGTITPGTTAGDAMADISGFTEPLNLTIQPFPEDSQATLNANKQGRVVNVPATESGLTLTLENLVLTGGAATAGSGGAAQILAGTVTMTGCEVKSNTANSGGGAYLANGEFTLESCKITRNSTSEGLYSSGGGLYLESGEFTLKNCEITSNIANTEYEGGGGIYLNGGTLTMEGGEITSNRISDYKCGGGGVYITGSGIFTMKSGKISENTVDSSKAYGGGVYIESNSAFTMEDGEISGNILSAVDGYGGGVYITGSGIFTMKSGRISENKATSTEGYGGGVYIESYGAFTMEDGEITENIAKTSGGGVYVASLTEFTMKSGRISGNTTTYNYGGGVYINYGEFTMSGGEISANIAKTSGGGVYIAGNGTFTMSGGEINNNNADNWGGGIYIVSGTLTMQNGTISGNEANYGGGIRINSGTVTIEGSSSAITGNTANSYAGGVYVAGSSTQFSMSDGEISGNNAETGGGVYIDTATFTMSGGKISGNNAIIKDGNGTGGDAGGVYIVGNGTFTMSGNSAISENNGSYGGGVHISNGTLTMSGNSTISRNTATGDGGGVYVASNGAFIMSGGTITGNDAQGNQTTGNSAGTSGGGGVYVFRSPDAGSDAKGIFTMTGGTITNNKASGSKNGNGVFVSPDGTFNMGGGAKVEANNDVYLNVYPDPKSIPTITVTGALTAASPVATITPASYVAGRQVLAGSGVTITQDICEKFALTENPDGADYEIAPGTVSGTTYGVIKSTTFYVRGSNAPWYASNYPSAQASDSNAGSRSLPFATIQKAVDKVIAENDGTSEYTIYVDGTFTATSTAAIADFNSGSKALSIKIQGLDSSNKAVIDGNKKACGIVVGSNAVQKNVNFALENVIIQNAVGDRGGGIVLCTYSENSHTIKNCEIKNNNAGYGSAIYESYGLLNMQNCIISGNTADTSGTIYIGQESAIFTMSDVTIENNSAYNGGGIFLGSNATVKISDASVVIRGNSAGSGRGPGINLWNGYLELSGSAKIADVVGFEGGTVHVVKVTGSLTGTSPVATIKPSSYTAGTEILTSGGVTITQTICDKFALYNSSSKIVPNSTGSLGVIQ